MEFHGVIGQYSRKILRVEEKFFGNTFEILRTQWKEEKENEIKRRKGWGEERLSSEFVTCVKIISQ